MLHWIHTPLEKNVIVISKQSVLWRFLYSKSYILNSILKAGFVTASIHMQGTSQCHSFGRYE